MGKGKSRLLSALDAAAKAQSQGPNVNQGAPNNPTQSGSGGNDASKQSNGQAAGSGEVEYKKGVPSQDFSEEDDKLLMRMKTDHASWQDISAKMNGKDIQKCKDRFKEIMPDDFFQKKNAGKGSGKGGKQDKQNNQKQNNKEQEKKDGENTEQATGDGGWGGFGDFGGMFGDANKSNASDKGPKKDDKGGTDDAATGAWDTKSGGNTKWEIDKSGGGDWNDAGKDSNAGGTNTWDINTGGTNAWDNNTAGANAWDNNAGDDWTKQASGGKNDNKKGEGKKSKEEMKQDKKRSEPKAAANIWDTGNGGFDSGGGRATTGFNAASGWQFGDNEDKKSESKKSKSSSSHSSNPRPKNVWGTDGENAGCGGTTPAAHRKPTSRPSSRDREKQRSSRRRSKSNESKHRSHRHYSSSHPGEYKVAPDSTFSQDELKLIARILQQDCSMVWDRVSWRFKDKTGRNLHPDVFEKKITGTLETERRH